MVRKFFSPVMSSDPYRRVLAFRTMYCIRVQKRVLLGNKRRIILRGTKTFIFPSVKMHQKKITNKKRCFKKQLLGAVSRKKKFLNHHSIL
jgi:hypothetical protein